MESVSIKFTTNLPGVSPNFISRFFSIYRGLLLAAVVAVASHSAGSMPKTATPEKVAAALDKKCAREKVDVVVDVRKLMDRTKVNKEDKLTARRRILLVALTRNNVKSGQYTTRIKMLLYHTVACHHIFCPSDRVGL